jgi:hypothetical protein
MRLIPESEPDLFCEHNLDGLLMGDLKSRYEAYNLGILGGHMLRNEARVLENRNPLPGLDEPLQPLNMVPAGEQPAAAIAPPAGAGSRRAALAADCARRIIFREAQVIRPRLKHAAADPQRFLAWAADWCVHPTAHPAYVARTITPFTGADRGRAIASQLTDALLLVLNTIPDPAAFAGVLEDREEAIAQILIAD